MACIGAKYLKKHGKARRSGRVGRDQRLQRSRSRLRSTAEKIDWLVMFKNETHNHPTEIEPFGGAATCLGGAIRDPLSGQSLRVSGYACDRRRGSAARRYAKTPGRQAASEKDHDRRRLTATAPTATRSAWLPVMVDEAISRGLRGQAYGDRRRGRGGAGRKRDARASRRRAMSSSCVGGRTGRDGCGGATGSSKAHTTESLVQLRRGSPEGQSLR